MDHQDPQTIAAFARVQGVLNAHKLRIETDELSGLTVVTGPDLDMRRGRGRTLLGAVRDFVRANSR